MIVAVQYDGTKQATNIVFFIDFEGDTPTEVLTFLSISDRVSTTYPSVVNLLNTLVTQLKGLHDEFPTPGVMAGSVTREIVATLNQLRAAVDRT
jgi:hypothetical protein